jgi:hypothetical protein
VSEQIVFVDSSEIREGKLEELEVAIHDLVEFVESNEPRPIAYNVYLNESGSRMTVVQVHPDSASMEFHMEVAGPAFSKFVELIKLSTMDVYGKPSDDLVEQIRQKIRMLGNGTVVVHELQAGFARFGLSAT